MYPHERSLARHLSDNSFAIIGVNSDRNLDSIRDTCVAKNITWRSFWNGEDGTGGPISKKWNVSGWPTTYLLDKDGVIRFKDVRGEALDHAITELLAEMGEEVSLVDIDHEAEDKIAMANLKEDKAEPKEEKQEAATEAATTEETAAEEKKEAAATTGDKAEDSKTTANDETKSEEAEAKEDPAKDDSAKDGSEKPKATDDNSGDDEAKEPKKDEVKKDEPKKDEVKKDEVKTEEDPPKDDAKASEDE